VQGGSSAGSDTYWADRLRGAPGVAPAERTATTLQGPCAFAMGRGRSRESLRKPSRRPNAALMRCSGAQTREAAWRRTARSGRVSKDEAHTAQRRI
jgi:hypothetical protein